MAKTKKQPSGAVTDIKKLMEGINRGFSKREWQYTHMYGECYLGSGKFPHVAIVFPRVYVTDVLSLLRCDLMSSTYYSHVNKDQFKQATDAVEAIIGTLHATIKTAYCSENKVVMNILPWGKKIDESSSYEKEAEVKINEKEVEADD